MKRIQKGPVRHLPGSCRRRERERRMDSVPDESLVKTYVIEVVLRGPQEYASKGEERGGSLELQEGSSFQQADVAKPSAQALGYAEG